MVEFFEPHGGGDLPRGEPAIPVEVHDLWLVSEPVATLQADGRLKLRWETVRPACCGRLSVGMHLHAGRTRTTVWRKTNAYAAAAPTRQHEAIIKGGWAIDPTYDAMGAAQQGRGELAYRLVLHDDAQGKAQTHDGEVGFRCEPTPCVLGETRFVQVPAFELGPFVDRVTPTSAVISFRTDVPTGAGVIVRGPGKAQRFASSQQSRDHEIPLTGLRPGQSYRYLVVARDAAGELAWKPHGTFTTAPEAAAPFRFSVLSDTRRSPGGGLSDYRGVNRRVLQQLFAEALQREVAFVIVVGDLIDGATTQTGAYQYQLDGWRQVATPFATHLPIYETMGNHENVMEAWLPGWIANRRGPSSAEALFAAAFVNPENAPSPASAELPTYSENVYSFGFGAAHFAVVNSDYAQMSQAEREDHPAAGRGFRQGWVTETQLTWLDDDLKRARDRGAQHLFVLTHEPAFPNGGHAKDAMYWDGKLPEVIARRNAFWQILSDNKVRAGLFGDEHNYSRLLVDEAIDPAFTTPVWSFITGGGGAPHYAQDRTLPWSDRVAAFSSLPHQVFFTVCGERVLFEAVSTSGEVLDSGEL